jgi:membrane-bound acyltransferase YfiQ involved in biofilm formation
MDKQFTLQLKGLSILMVIIGHLSLLNVIPIPLFNYLGTHGVTLFLFISGYGLTQSYQNSIDQSFIKKRLLSVFMPYFVITLILIFIDSRLGKNYSIGTILLTLSSFDPARTIDKTMWYIPFIILWYSIFYLTFKFTTNNKIRISILLLFGILLNFVSRFSLFGEFSYQWPLYSFIFPLGVTYSLIRNKLRLIISKYFSDVISFLILLSTFCLMIMSTCYKLVQVNDFYFTTYNVCFMILIIITLLKIKFLKIGFLEFIGYFSYELYLVEGIFIWKYSLMDFNRLVSIVVYLIAILVSALVLKILINIVKEKVK